MFEVTAMERTLLRAALYAALAWCTLLTFGRLDREGLDPTPPAFGMLISLAALLVSAPAPVPGRAAVRRSGAPALPCRDDSEVVDSYRTGPPPPIDRTEAASPPQWPDIEGPDSYRIGPPPPIDPPPSDPPPIVRPPGRRVAPRWIVPSGVALVAFWLAWRSGYTEIWDDLGWKYMEWRHPGMTRAALDDALFAGQVDLSTRSEGPPLLLLNDVNQGGRGELRFRAACVTPGVIPAGTVVLMATVTDAATGVAVSTRMEEITVTEVEPFPRRGGSGLYMTTFQYSLPPGRYEAMVSTIPSSWLGARAETRGFVVR
jgi:hypothetical protein